MKKIMYPLLAVLILAGSAFTFIAAADWKIATGYSIGFSAGSEAAGVFKDFAGTIAFDESSPAAGKFDVTVQVASVNTGNGLQNKHIKSDEWFDATKYPTIKYTSRAIAKTAIAYQVTGDL